MATIDHRLLIELSYGFSCDSGNPHGFERSAVRRNWLWTVFALVQQLQKQGVGALHESNCDLVHCQYTKECHSMFFCGLMSKCFA
jgi:hypothetical protein